MFIFFKSLKIINAVNLFLHEGERLITLRYIITVEILTSLTDSILELKHKIELILRLPQDSLSSSFRFCCVILFIQERINEESVFGNLTRKNMAIVIGSKKFYSRSKYGAKVRARACGA